MVVQKSIPWDNPFSHVPIKAPPRPTDSPQWLKDLDEKGWAIVKGVITPEEAAQYRDKANDWLEGFKMGYKRDDPSTWHKQNLPRHVKGGLYYAYSFAHSQWVWDIKSTPAIVNVFEKIWGTDKLTVSFDGGNLSVPLPKDEIEDEGAPWPHVDQSPLKPELASIQGLLNLCPNGPEDGGLKVLSGSVKYFTETFKEFDHQAPPGGWDSHDHVRHPDDRVDWLKVKGCEWIKPSLDPGDFIVWDSRTVHYGEAPQKQNHRMAVYVCYKPDEYLSDEARKEKIELFEKGWCTSHDPCTFIAKRDQDADWNINFPYGKPVLTGKAKKAVGLIPY